MLAFKEVAACRPLVDEIESLGFKVTVDLAVHSRDFYVTITRENFISQEVGPDLKLILNKFLEVQQLELHI